MVKMTIAECLNKMWDIQNLSEVDEMADDCAAMSATVVMTGGAFDDIRAAHAQMKLKRAEGDAFKVLAERVKGYTVPKGILTLLDSVYTHINTFSRPETETEDPETGEKTKTPAYTPSVSISVVFDRSPDTTDDKGKVIKGKVTANLVATPKATRAARSSNGSKSKNSRTSAWEAYKRGVKKGDPDVIVKVDGGFQHGETFIKTRKDGGLQQYVTVTQREMFPHTVADLAEYGQDNGA